MDDYERDTFVAAMQDINPDIADYLEALLFALESVRSSTTQFEVRYFGTVGNGTFYADGDPENTRWFPDTSEGEAICSLGAEFGEAFTEGLECSY